MKKLTLVLLIIIAAVAVIGPGISGHFLKSYHDDMTAQFNRQYPMYKLKYTQTEDGWFSSRYEYQVEMNIPAGADPSTAAEIKELTQFSSELTYYHGPLPFAALANDAPFYPSAGTYSYEFDYAQALSDLAAQDSPENAAALAQLPPISGEGWIQYNSDAYGTANTPATSITLNDGYEKVTVDLGALKANTTMNLNTGKAVMYATMPKVGIKPEGDQGEISLNGLIIDITSELTANQYPLINGVMEVADVNYQMKDYSGEHKGELKGFAYNFSGQQQGDYIDSSIGLSIDSFTNEEVSIDAASFNFEYNHMHEPSLGKLYQQYQGFITSVYTDPYSFERNMEQKLAELEPHALKLIQHKPELGATLRYTSKNGTGEVLANVHINKASDDQLASLKSLQEAASLVPVVFAKATANIPESVARDIVSIAVDQDLNAQKKRGREVPPEQREQMIQQLLGMPVAQGFLKLVEQENGEKAYTGEAIFENMKLLLNGNEIPLGAFM